MNEKPASMVWIKENVISVNYTRIIINCVTKTQFSQPDDWIVNTHFLLQFQSIFNDRFVCFICYYLRMLVLKLKESNEIMTKLLGKKNIFLLFLTWVCSGVWVSWIICCCCCVSCWCICCAICVCGCIWVSKCCFE